jgi:hypothetical protein
VVKVTPELKDLLKNVLQRNPTTYLVSGLINSEEQISGSDHSLLLWVDKRTFLVERLKADIKLQIGGDQSSMETSFDFAVNTDLVISDVNEDFIIKLPEEDEGCKLEHGISCNDDFRIVDAEDEDYISLVLSNGRGLGVLVTSVKASGQEDIYGTNCEYNAVADSESWEGKEGFYIGNGESTSVRLDCIPAGSFDGLAGSKERFNLDVAWYNADSEIIYSHTAEGMLLATVEAE